MASRLASLAIRLDALELTSLRLLAAADHGDWIRHTIAGGSSEIQRNIIAKHVLGL